MTSSSPSSSTPSTQSTPTHSTPTHSTPSTQPTTNQSNNPTHTPFNHFIIIGAGPAGLLSATGLAKRGYTVHVYESRQNIDQRPEESYPIGLNLRGLRAINRVAGPPFADRLTKEGYPVKDWSIQFNGRQVANVFSGGACLSHTRFAVTKTCFDAATGIIQDDESDTTNYSSRVKIHFDKKLKSFNPMTKTLIFEDGTTLVLNDSTGLIAGDGVWSQIRKGLLSSIPSHPLDKQISETVIPWGIAFRVLFMDKSIPKEFDNETHYIFNAVYAAVTGSDGKWSLVPSCRPESEPDVAKWFESTEATPENIASLKHYIQQRVPVCKKVEDYFSEKELSEFFTRRVFKGALTHVTWSSFGGNVQLLGDSARSLYPASGEGVNSALDDVAHLMDCFDVFNGLSVKTMYDIPKVENARSPFDLYANSRQIVIDALHALVKDIMLMQAGTGQEKAQLILGSIFGKLSGKKTLETDYRYGPTTRKELLPYEEIVARHYEMVKGPRKVAKWFVNPFGDIKKSKFGQGNVNIESVWKSVRV